MLRSLGGNAFIRGFIDPTGHDNRAIGEWSAEANFCDGRFAEVLFEEVFSFLAELAASTVLLLTGPREVALQVVPLVGLMGRARNLQ